MSKKNHDVGPYRVLTFLFLKENTQPFNSQARYLEGKNLRCGTNFKIYFANKDFMKI